MRCLGTGEIFEDDYTLHFTDGALVIADYKSKLEVKSESKGVWKYEDWLPVSKATSDVAGTVTYKAEALGKELGLTNLWVTFHGYWPERKAICPTGAFKDMEAVPTIQRMRDHGCKGIICASAGNTARAFTHFCGKNNFPLIVVVAGIHLDRVWVTEDVNLDSVKIVVVEDGDYLDAKLVSKEIAAKLDGWQLEGGAHNIARRDGIGSLILDAWNEIGHLPDHYFQGVGGGPGPIGVQEMMQRLVNFDLAKGPVSKIHLSQNPEHCPIHNAWQDKRAQLKETDFPKGEVDVYSDYLLNKAPSYGIKGGVYDILHASNGETYVVSKEEAIEASKLFERVEGIDIMSPSAVALGSLVQAKEMRTIQPDDCIVLNISGGGVNRLKRDKKTRVVEPWLVAPKNGLAESVLKKLNNQ